MPQKLSSPIDDKVRRYVVQNADPAGMEGYDPQQSDTTANDYILITTNNDDYGEYYPCIWISENENGPVIPNSGNTNANGLAGDGSGTIQTATHNVTISVQAVEGGPYLNNTSYDTLAFEIYQEVKSLFGGEINLDDETLWTGELTPGTKTENTEETDSGSTITWLQYSGTLPVGVQYTP